MEIALSIAFVIAAVAFFKEQLKFGGYWSLLAAFVIVLIVAWLPELVAFFPASGPFVDKFVLVVQLFIGAVGGREAVVAASVSAQTKLDALRGKRNSAAE